MELFIIYKYIYIYIIVMYEVILLVSGLYWSYIVYDFISIPE